MATKRTRVETLIVTDLAHADQVLAEVAEIDRQLTEAEAELNRKIDELKQAAAKRTDGLSEKREALALALAAFAAYHKGVLFKDRRSIEQVHGTIGFRRSEELRTEGRKTTWADVLERIEQAAKATDPEEFDFAGGVRSKKDVAKEVLKLWPTERLSFVGAKLEPKDVFFFETKQVSLGG